MRKVLIEFLPKNPIATCEDLLIEMHANKFSTSKVSIILLHRNILF